MNLNKSVEQSTYHVLITAIKNANVSITVAHCNSAEEAEQLMKTINKSQLESVLICLLNG